MPDTQLDQSKQQLDDALRKLSDLDGKVARPVDAAVAAAPVAAPPLDLAPVVMSAPPADTLRTLTRLLVGAALLGVDELARRAPEWERRVVPVQSTAGTTAAPQPAVPASANTGVAPAASSRSAGVEMRRALIGWAFAAQERLGAANDPASWLQAAAGHMVATAAALAHESLYTLVGGPPTGATPASDPQLARWIALGHVEERRSRALAQVALHEIVQDVLSAMTGEPAVRELIRMQSTSLANEALDEVRQRAVSADMFVDSLLHRVLRRPRAQALTAGDLSADMEARE